MKQQILIPLMAFLFLASCTNDNINTLSYPTNTNNPSNSTVTYSNTIQGIISSNCIGCHGASNPSAGFDISSYTKAKNNISKIISRIDQQTGQPGIMPPNGRMIESNIQAFKDWQTQGFVQ